MRTCTIAIFYPDIIIISKKEKIWRKNHKIAAYCIRMGAGKPLSCFAFSRQGAILQQVEGNPIYPKVVGLKQTIDCIYIRFLITV